MSCNRFYIQLVKPCKLYASLSLGVVDIFLLTCDWWNVTQLICWVKEVNTEEPIQHMSLITNRRVSFTEGKVAAIIEVSK